jgi:hypothetical protein
MTERRISGLRMVLAQSTLAVGRFSWCRGRLRRRRRLLGRRWPGNCGPSGVRALQLPVDVDGSLSGRSGLIVVAVTLQEPGGGEQDARGDGGVLV